MKTIATALLAGAISLSAVGCVGGLGGSDSSVYDVPDNVQDDCSVDVTKQLVAWIASIPDYSELAFSHDACYRIEGTVELSERRGLEFDGKGSTFRSVDPLTDHRSLWRVVESEDIALHDMTLDGAYAHGGTYDSRVEHSHAIELVGSSIDIANVTMKDVGGDCVYFGRGSKTVLTLSSGTVRDSSCSRTGRNALAVVAGNNILVQRVTTDAIGYNVFDVEPNLNSGWGSIGATFDDNSIGSYARNTYSIVEGAPIGNQAFTNNRVTGQGLKVAIGDPMGLGYRPRNVVITGNSSDTPQAPAAFNVDNVDGLTLTGNVVPMEGGPMAAIAGSCKLTVAGNVYSGGTTEALIYPSVCSFTPAHGHPGSRVVVDGSGFTGTTAVTVGGRRVPFRVRSDGLLALVMPKGAVSGPIHVVAPNGTATSGETFAIDAP